MASEEVAASESPKRQASRPILSLGALSVTWAERLIGIDLSFRRGYRHSVQVGLAVAARLARNETRHNSVTARALDILTAPARTPREPDFAHNARVAARDLGQCGFDDRGLDRGRPDAPASSRLAGRGPSAGDSGEQGDLRSSDNSWGKSGEKRALPRNQKRSGFQGFSSSGGGLNRRPPGLRREGARVSGRSR
jgi:hypothetical protein